MIYLDYAAATPLDPEVFEAMKPWLTERFANPSSIYQSGQEARAAVDEARVKIANFLKCKATEVYFTASGTESCNWAIRGVLPPCPLERGKRSASGEGVNPHLIVSAIEHSAVLEMARYLEQYHGTEVTYLPVGSDGIVRVDDLKNALRPETGLISVMMVNNEIGTVQPVAEIGAICRERGITFHTDACQAAGYYDLEVKELNVDLLSFNAGKIYGPKGVAVLFIRDGVKISPWTIGGGQEFRKRAGTENVAGIVGMGRAVELIRNDSDTLNLRNKLWSAIQKNIEGVELNGSFEQRVASNLNVFIPGVDGEGLVRRLDLLGIAISTGSACASGSVEPSHVLMALGHDETRARSSIRITLGRQTTDDDIVRFAAKLEEVVSALRK